MLRIAVFVSALTLVPSFAAAQAPCTSDARRVVEEMYRHVLDRAPDNASQGWLDRLSGGATVREIVRGIAKVVDQLIDSPEYQQTFGDWRVPGSSGVSYCISMSTATASSIATNGTVATTYSPDSIQTPTAGCRETSGSTRTGRRATSPVST